MSVCPTALLLSVFLTTAARGDGGVVVARDISDGFEITVFAATEPVRAGTADLSVLLEDRDSGAPILDADITLHLTPPAQADAGAPTSVPFTRAQATNKLLYAAPVALPVPGTWMLALDVRSGSRGAQLHGSLPVAGAAPTLNAIWPYLLLPPVALLVFALHQWLSGSRALSR